MTEGAPAVTAVRFDGPPLVALVVGRATACVALPTGPDDATRTLHWPLVELVEQLTELEARMAPRWVIWSAATTLREVVAARVAVARTWDLAEAHRIVHGGWWATPGHVWAGCHGLAEAEVPAPHRHRAGFDGDLFDLAGGHENLLSESGHLRADALTSWGRPTRATRAVGAGRPRMSGRPSRLPPTHCVRRWRRKP